jgi:predicted ATPase
MIKEVHVRNYRGIGDATVHLEPLTVLVGPNGAGKSSFVDVLRFVKEAVTLGLDDAILNRHGVVALRRWAPSKPFDVEIDLSIEAKAFRVKYGFCIASGKEGEYSVKREYCRGAVGKTSESFERDGNHLSISSSREIHENGSIRGGLDGSSLAISSLSFLSPLFSRTRQYLRGMNFCTVFPNTLREPQKPSPQEQLSDHGDNLASVLRLLKKTPWHEELRAALGKVVEEIDDVRVRQVGGFLVTELRHRMNGKHSAWFDLSQESDGTLRMLGLLVAIYQHSRFRSLLAVEEPELTLHPGALGVLSDVLLDASKKSQLLLTTQSPDLIARFPARVLRVVEREDGVTAIGAVEESQRRAVEDQLFTSGDLLRIEGLRRQIDS